MKNKKKGSGKKTWRVDCRTDGAFNFAMEILKKSEDTSYPFALRINFVKIAFDNCCETVAKAQTNPETLHLKATFKFFQSCLNNINKAAHKLHSEVRNPRNANISSTEYCIQNPFDYFDIDYMGIYDVIEDAKRSKKSKEQYSLKPYVKVYSYPKIFIEVMKPGEMNIDSKLLPTNDIRIYLPRYLKTMWTTNKITDMYENTPDFTQIGRFSAILEGLKVDEPIYTPPVLINCPYDSFENITKIVTTAANHPENVKEIGLTAYRLGDNNGLIEAIIIASNNKIPCKVFIEMNARGEVFRNINYLEQMLNRGDMKYIDIKLNYNDTKVHGKMIYIDYSYNRSKRSTPIFNTGTIGIFSTGNYNPDTAKIYKDYHYISTAKDVTDLIHHNFNILWNQNQPILSSISNIIVKELYEQIARGPEGRIWIQTNHLDNKRIVKLLKEAVKRGCDVKLIVRTTKGFHKKDFKCCKTVIGKYLEHSRVYIFGKDKPSVYISSSDLLFRNLYNRFESYIKIHDTIHEYRLMNEFERLYNEGQV